MSAKAYNQKYYRRNSKRLKRQASAYRRKNRKAILKQRKKSYQKRKRMILKRNKDWRGQNKDKISLQKRLQRLRLMGLSSQELQKVVVVLSSVVHCCEICGTKVPGGNGGWSVDHNHKTKKFRGVLCNSCNALLGFCKDQIRILKKAISYLKVKP
jgi:hypothetical protein